MTKEELIQRLDNTLPEMWERKRTTKLTGGVVNSGTLSNRMCEGTGPAGTFRRGRTVILTKKDFLKWFSDEIEELPNEKKKRPDADGIG